MHEKTFSGLEAYKIFLVFGILVIVVIGSVMGLPIAKQFVGLSDYELYVEAIIDNRQTIAIGQVVIQNSGSQPLTNVIADFGEDNVVELGTIDVRERIILTPPESNKMELVTVYADDHIYVSKEYREEKIHN